ncbi:MAG: cytochrome P450 [Chloroflexota bacterium]
MNNKIVPGPKGSFVIGSVRDFAQAPPDFLLEMAQTYGPIAKFQLLNQTIFLVSEPEYIRDVLIKQRDNFPKGPLDRQILGKFLGNGLVTSDGDFHKRQRRLVQPAFHMKRIRGYAETIVDLTDRMLSRWEDGTIYDMGEEMMEVTMLIVSKSLFDANVDDLHENTHRIGKAIEDLQRVSNADYRRGFSFPDWLPLKGNRERKAGVQVLNETLDKIIAERRQARENGSFVDNGDLLSMLLLAQDEDGGHMTDRQVRDEAVTLFAAGHETTSNALTWTWYLLAQHPEVEARLHEEVDRVLDGRLPTLTDLPNLPYTEMIVKESMRLYPPVWTLNGRYALNDTEIDGYAIPKGSLIFISPWVMHRLPQYFPNPEVFDPERFAPEREKEMPRYTYLPFGAGPRVCIGKSFAMMEAHLILATMAQRFRFNIAPNQTIEPNPLITLSPKEGLKMEAVARAAEPAYSEQELVLA